MIRPLPVAVVLMGVLGVVKAGSLLGHGLGTGRVVATALAATVGTAEAAHPAPGKAQPDKPQPDKAAPGTPQPGKEAARPAVPAAAGAKPLLAPSSAAPPAPPQASEAEMKLLTDLRGRRTAMDGREEALSAREAVVAAAEQRLAARAGELEGLQSRLQALDAARHERDEANWHGLVRTYEAMKPKDAATIMTELDDAVLLPVLDRMKENKVAPILGAMPPDRARTVTAELARMRLRANTPAGGG